MRNCNVWKFACRTVALALAGSWIAGSVSARGLPGQFRPLVVGQARVVDGDTLQVADTRIRLEGIDAPEAAQTCMRADGGEWPCGSIASAELERLVRGRTVSCDATGLDKYGRTLAVCRVDGTDINADMVRRGLAWAFVRYSPRYVGEEALARQAHAGIWQGPATPAWEYREQQWMAAAAAAPRDCAIKGNVGRNGAIYHMPWSPWYTKVRMDAGHGKRWFCSEADALAAGFRPALWH